MAALKSNTLIVIEDTTLATSIKPALVDELRVASKDLGIPVSRILNEAVDWYTEIQYPIYMQKKQNKNPKTYGKEGAVFRQEKFIVSAPCWRLMEFPFSVQQAS